MIEAARYLKASGGEPAKYRKYIENPVTREGQAFFLACTDADKALLRGTAFDPFYGDAQAVLVAVDYLRAKNGL